MKLIIPYLTGAVFLMAGAVQAGTRCSVPMTDWQPRDAIARLAAENGWTVRRIKIDDGCYEIKGRDANGRQIEVKIHPGTLAIIKREFEDEDDDDKRDSKKSDKD